MHPGLTASHLCGDKPLIAKATWPIAKDTCRACAVPNRYIVNYHKLIPEFLSQIDISETVSDVSEYTFHEANDPIDSGYHSP